MVSGLVWDVGLPVAVYYLLHVLGCTDWVALLAAAGTAVARIAVVAVRHRRLNQFALVMLLIYGIGVLLALLAGDPRALLLRNSLITASIGAVFLVTAATRRPLTLTSLQSFAPDRADRMAQQYADNARARHGFKLAAVAWGLSLMAEAIARIPLVYLLPLEIAVGATEALLLGTILTLGAWTVWYLRRNREHFTFD